MSKPHIATFGKLVQRVARLRGGGSALPGLVVEKIDPHFTRDILATLPHGVVIISGTNGKTTTTKMTVELLESQGLRVFTNRTGSNFARGVTAALLSEVDYHGKLDADIAVLELDEAHAVHFVKTIPPTCCLLLNVMRDQLDRFGEIDTTTNLLTKIAESTTTTVVLNREDSRIASISQTLPKNISIRYFGFSPSLQKKFLHDDTQDNQNDHKRSHKADVILTTFSDKEATFKFDGKEHTTTLALKGIYNTYNAAAALALTRAILQNAVDTEKLMQRLATIEPAFGRGETIFVDKTPIDLVLVKNPGGFRLALQSFSPTGISTMIAINDNYADGRDMSWLWDVDFHPLQATGVDTVSGIRAYDMTLRLQYDDIKPRHTNTNIAAALKNFLAHNPSQPKRIYCTYTAMLTLRKELSKLATIEEVL